MAEGKSSFVLYCEIIHTVEKLSDEKAGALFKHLLKYVTDQNPETDDIIIQIAFEPIKQQLKRSLKKWENRAKTSRENGKSGGRPRKDEKPKITQNNPVGFSETNQDISKPEKPVSVPVPVPAPVNEPIELLEKVPKEPSKKKSGVKKKNLEPEKGDIDLEPFSENFRPVWNDWIDYKKNELKKSFKLLRTQQSAFRHLVELSKANEVTAQKIIKQSIANQWQGLFELKNGNNGQTGNNHATGVKQTGTNKIGTNFNEPL